MRSHLAQKAYTAAPIPRLPTGYGKSLPNTLGVATQLVAREQDSHGPTN